MKLADMKNIFNKKGVKYTIVFSVSFLAIYIVMLTSLITKKYDIKEGDIAKYDIQAPREVKDRIATQQRIDDAVSQVDKQYTQKTDAKSRANSEINQIFTSFAQIKASQGDDNKAKITKIKTQLSSLNITLSDVDMNTILGMTSDEAKSLQTLLVETLSNLYDNNNIQANDNNSKFSESIKNAKSTVSDSLINSKFNQEIINMSINLVNQEIKPNMVYDKEKTDELIKQVKSNIKNVIIKKDQIIIKKGEPVTNQQIEVLKDLGVLNNNKTTDWYIYASLAVVVCIVMAFQWYYISKYHKEIFKQCKMMILIGILNFIALILARTLYIISPFLIPLLCIPMLYTLLLNDKISLAINTMNCILITIVSGFNIQIVLLAILNSVLGVIILRKMQQRNDIIYSALIIAVMNAIFVFAGGFLLSNNIVEIAKNTGYSFLACMISAVLAIGFLPFFESSFDIVTTVKLLELSNPNQPLLKRLLLEAPGTYHHSVLVGNLSELAAEEIGANTVLARVSSYYHDIGKIKRPYFFKENQLAHENPHDKITPNLSTLIITSHVKDGLELAKESNLPKIIQDVIQQHHGTYLVKYFYLTVKNSSKNPDDVEEENFRYGGPIPQTKEAGIIMLADAVEASVRSITDPTKGKIEEMVNNIIKDRLNAGQLDDCDITLKDLSKIRQAFLKTLTSIYHGRIEYPADKWDNKKQM